MIATPARTHLARGLRGLTWLALALLAGPLLYALLALAFLIGPPSPVAQDAQAPSIEAYVISNGVHTDLLLPLQSAQMDWRQHFAPTHALAAPADASFISIGWGDREFYLHTPTWADLTLARAWGALWGQHSAALHVSWLQRAQLPQQRIWQLPLSPAQYQRLVQQVLRSLPAGQAQPIAGAHYTRQDAFYEASGHYQLLRTCNEWTAQALRAAGVPVSRWAPFEAHVRWHLKAGLSQAATPRKPAP